MRDPITGGRLQPNAVDNGAQDQEGNAGKQLLQCQGDAQLEENRDLTVKMQVLPCDGKRKVLPPLQKQ